MCRSILLVAVASILCLSPSPAQDKSPTAPPKEVVELISKLGDPDFATREAAEKALSQLGEAARQAIVEATKSEEAEIRTRATRILAGLNRAQRLATGVHVVGLYEAGSRQHFRLVGSWGRDTDWVRLCATLVEQGKKADASPAKRVWELLPKATQDIAADEQLVARANAWAHDPSKPDREAITLLRTLTSGLTDALLRPDFHDAKAFAQVALDAETKDLLKRQKELTALEQQILNRRLFEAAFPNVVTKSPVTLEGLTVAVRVKATKDPIILVLCSYESVIWKVETEKGAKIDKVIVGGYHLSEVTGTTAPVVHRQYERQEQGKDKNQQGPRYFYAYSQKDPKQYQTLVDAVRALTDREIATFQGRYSYSPGNPFEIVGR